MKSCFWALAFFWIHTAFATEQIEFATHYDHPPFVVDMKSRKGLVFDLADYLTKRSRGKYNFQVTFVPRERLQTYLDRNQKVVVPFVAKNWFDCPTPRPCLWTDVLVMDRNVVVALTSAKFEYKGPNSLKGKTLGVVIGRISPELQEIIDKGIVTLEESPTQVGNFQKLIEGRIDLLVTGEIIAKDIIAREGWQSKLSISSEPLQILDRRILVSPRTQVDLHKWLNAEVKNMDKSDFFQARLLPSSSPKESPRVPAKAH